MKTFVAPLFVPAERPDRVEKAIRSGADAVIVDLEDAVAPASKALARELAVTVLSRATPECAVYVRVNGPGTPDLLAADLEHWGPAGQPSTASFCPRPKTPSRSATSPGLWPERL
jgi:citrate lyase beta subunit